ncbi:MAG: PQQ-binding-like beta-propeller repeat protein [Planctomycetes bacterium]|nr:PQQ-binding-like beta-propeller repeat protein [Planctomycetota bacterium]
MSNASNSNAQPQAARSLLRRFLFPIIVFVVITCIAAAGPVMEAMELDTEAAIPVLMVLQPGVILGVLALGIWWLFFSGFSWLTRFAALGLLAVGIGAFALSLTQVELTSTPTGLRPIFHFVWETTDQDRYAEYQAQHPVGVNDVVVAVVGPNDFPGYRGPNRDGVLPDAKLQTDWTTHSPKQVWQRPCFDGYSGIAVAGNLVVTLEQRGKQEGVVCYDRTTGSERWVFAYDAFHRDIMGNGPRSTPTIHDGRIFTLGATGEFLCLDVEGKKKWGVNILEDSKAKNIKWGMTGSPLIFKDLVIAHAGVDPENPAGAALVAFEQKTGKKAWAIGNRRAGYSSPQLATLAGVTQILLFDGDGLVGYDPDSRQELWSFPWKTDFDMNSIQPVVLSDGRVFISSELANGCAMLRIAHKKNSQPAWSVDVVWKNKNLAARFANPVSDGKRIFGLHGLAGQLRCLDAISGDVVWRGERCGPGQMLLAGDTLLVVHEKGVVTLLDKDSASDTELARQQMLGTGQKKWKTWNTPALAGDQLFVRNQSEIACWKLPQR